MTVRWPFPTSRNCRNERAQNDSSDFITAAYGSSNNFVTGDYDHNLEIMDNLQSASMRDDVDEDRLIYLATKKFARQSDYQSRRQIVVSSEELNSDSAQLFSSEGSQVGRASGMDQLQNFFLIFKGDDSYIEVSKEEIQRVRVMHKRFSEGSEFSFNYNTLLIIASIIAALGLGSNSTATIIASMLVSPLMGPVMGMAYGATISDFRLFYKAFKTEFISLLACIGVGAVVSGCMIPFLDFEYLGKKNLEDVWPTPEMYSRGMMSGFWVGFPIAFASGLGVAVSVLDEQTSSLVGVAISASLLPPAINAGMLWTTYFFDHHYHPDEAIEFGMQGLISLGLTLINILMIIISSMLMFRLKEKLPIKKKKIFWSDLGLARKVYKNQAIYGNDNPESAMRRVGRRVSAMFSSTLNLAESSEINSQNNRSASRTSFATSNNQEAGTTLEVPKGTEDDADTTANNRPRTLSTVQEERLSGYYSS